MPRLDMLRGFGIDEGEYGGEWQGAGGNRGSKASCTTHGPQELMGQKPGPGSSPALAQRAMGPKDSQ